jgi:hypothetical protein
VFTPAGILALAVVAGLALATIPYWILRSWRTAVLLLAAAAAILAVDLSDLRPAAAIELGIAGGVAILVLRGDERLWAMRVADRRYVEALAKVRGRIEDLRQRLDKTDPTDYAREFESLIDQLVAIPAPSEDWAILQAEAASELRDRLAVMRGASPATSLDEANERLQRTEEGFANLIRAKTSFWLLWS